MLENDNPTTDKYGIRLEKVLTYTDLNVFYHNTYNRHRSTVVVKSDISDSIFRATRGALFFITRRRIANDNQIQGGK
jgi:hypothetical protein